MIKLNWFRGKSLGLALIYLGAMGLFQICFIALGQYGMKVGSRPLMILIPIAVIFATFYSILIIFESNTSMSEYRNTHKFKHSKYSKNKSLIAKITSNIYLRPPLYVIAVFTVMFF